MEVSKELVMERVDVERHIVVSVHHSNGTINRIGVCVNGYMGVRIAERNLDIHISEEVGDVLLDDSADHFKELVKNTESVIQSVSSLLEERYKTIEMFFEEIRKIADLHNAKIIVNKVMDDP
jgi:hypothetical protein